MCLACSLARDRSQRLSELGRRARFYQLTAAGRRQMDVEFEDWGRLTSAINRELRLV